jgi:hypothetical protein
MAYAAVGLDGLGAHDQKSDDATLEFKALVHCLPQQQGRWRLGSDMVP